MLAISTIVFDLGGVLIDWDPRYLYRKIFEDKKEMEYFLSEVCPLSWNFRMDCDLSMADGIAERIALFPQYKSQIEAWEKRWPEMMGGVLEKTEVILDALAASDAYKLYALTNWSADTFHHALERFDFLHKFEDILVSGREKMVKPDPRIYQKLLNDFEIETGRSVFIDDNQANITAARDAGMQAIHFLSVEQLAADLEEIGVEF